MKAIVVSFDHLPVGFLGLHGNTWVDTPAFDRLAAEGVAFDQHLTADATGETVPHAWWTGRQRANGQPSTGLATALRDRGVRTTLFVEGPANRGSAVPTDFDRTTTVEGEDGLDVAPDATPFARLVAVAGEWLASSPEGDWLLWLKSRGVPTPWLPPREFAERYVPLFEEFEDDDELEGFEGVGSGDEFEWELVGVGEEEHDDEDLEFEDDHDEPYAESPTGPADSVLADTEIDDEDLTEDVSDASDDAVDDAADDAEDVDDSSEWDVDEAAEFDELLRALAAVALRNDTSALETADWLLVRAVYAGYVALLDRGLGALCRAIAETVGDEVLLIVTGGAGEALGERADLPAECDALGLGEEVIHAPLLVRGPGVQAGARRLELAQTVDVVPTLLEWFAAACPEVDGRSVLPLVRGESDTGHASLVVSGPHGRRGLRTVDRYLVTEAPGESAVTKMFVKPEDVWDLHDIASQERKTVGELTALLRAAES